MKEKLKSLIILGKMKEAKAVFKEMNYDEARDIILEIGYDTESIAPYSFVCTLLCEKESANLHYLASEILVNPLCFLVGAYRIALYHARSAVRLAPNDITFKEYLLLFYNIPDQLINKEEAIEIAREIVKKVPDNKHAVDILSNI